MLHTYTIPQSRLRWLYGLSLLIAVMMAARSLVGILNHTVVYPSNDLYQSFVSNDVVNIAIGLPVLIVSMWLAWRGRLSGLLLWPGALFYILYNYTIYVFAMPPGGAWMVDLLLVVMCLSGMFGLLRLMDRALIQANLQGHVSERISGSVLTGLGILILVQVIGALVTEISGKTDSTNMSLALHIADGLIAPAWIIGGLALWRRKTMGYVVGLGLLFQGSMLFIALIVYLLLQPMLTGTPFLLTDIVVVAVMGLICFVPFVRFLRGIDSGQAPL